MKLPEWMAQHPGAMLSDGQRQWDASSLANHLQQMADALSQLEEANPIGILGDNSLEWLAADLAMMQAGRICVPLPPFFSEQQIQHLMLATGMRHAWLNGSLIDLSERYPASPNQAAQIPAGTQKITFTSGTTGAPKGICLSGQQQLDTAKSLFQALSPLQVRKHLNLLPLSVLLENIAGVYAPLMAGAEVICLPQDQVGMSGSSRFDADKALQAIAKFQAESMILLPQMLAALVARVRPADERLRSLKYVAVGGAACPPSLIRQARVLGIPVYEGYGLSECASVVSLNVPGDDRVGSIGKPLPGVKVRIDQQGEIQVQGRGHLGVIGDRSQIDQDWLATGDLGEVDDEGYLHITGRKKHVLITAYGRNVSPEWPEGLLLDTGLFAQAVVMGDGMPELYAVLVPLSSKVGTAELEARIQQVNSQLPDYARIAHWMLADEPFTPNNGLATANGRPRRAELAAKYLPKFNQEKDTCSSSN